MTRYVEANKNAFGVEPICQVLEIAPPLTTLPSPGRFRVDAGAMPA